ncbi:hypothetical protein OBBRIDRAFT_835217 [Obba rivulosa]|uniref:Uncharacterized protein n=1 Tax=Obba rivulosa TaxID=1052685 RepID=A0A8E2AXM8_9APHY|nr:hypothetical protein OBBRIDRAFT_835217 [Obba rivulosa]
MAPPHWATKEQKRWLVANIPRFREFQEKKVVSKFWSGMYRIWFAKYPEWKVLFGGDYKPDLTPEEDARYGVAIQNRKKKLYNWFNNYQADQGHKAMQTRALSAWLMNMCMRPHGQHRLQLTEYYSQQYYDTKVRLLVQAEIEQHITQGEKVNTISIVKRLTREMFDNEPNKVKDEIRVLWDAEHMALANTIDETEDEELPTPESYRRSLDDMPAVLRQLLEELVRRTGWCYTIIAGGPDPGDGGAIRSISMHVGEPGEAGDEYGDTNPSFKDDTIKPFLSFLKDVYPKKVRETWALGYKPPDGPAMRKDPLGLSSDLANGHVVTVATTENDHASSSAPFVNIPQPVLNKVTLQEAHGNNIGPCTGVAFASAVEPYVEPCHQLPPLHPSALQAALPIHPRNSNSQLQHLATVPTSVPNNPSASHAALPPVTTQSAFTTKRNTTQPGHLNVLTQFEFPDATFGFELPFAPDNLGMSVWDDIDIPSSVSNHTFSEDTLSEFDDFFLPDFDMAEALLDEYKTPSPEVSTTTSGASDCTMDTPIPDLMPRNTGIKPSPPLPPPLNSMHAKAILHTFQPIDSNRPKRQIKVPHCPDEEVSLAPRASKRALDADKVNQYISNGPSGKPPSKCCKIM